MDMQKKVDHLLWLCTVALAAWVLPGAGHFLLSERKRALLIFLTITLTFAAGLWVGSIGVIDSVAGWAWYIAQIMVSPAAGIIDHITRSQKIVSFARPSDIGQIYTSVAGLLNLLCVINAVYLAYTGRGERIGQEETNA